MFPDLSTLSLTWWVAAGVSTTVLMVSQPVFLKIACSLCGQKPPRYLMAAMALMATTVVGSVVGVVYAITLGPILSGASPALAGLAGLVLSGLATSIVYSAFLRVAVLDAARVAAVHYVIGIGTSAVVAAGLQLLA